ncbi:hypothetical protein KA057_02135 [Candidatus Gracilibacteria bacterium]|nr:hypothetical protein [Candidatus Gracilibacteria bacterium]
MVQKIGRFLILFFIGFLPWSVALTVLGTERLGLEWMRFSKEIFLGVIITLGIIDALLKRRKIVFGSIDIFIALYVVTLLAVSLIQGASVTGMVYGLRYDAEFLIAFVALRQILGWWNISFRELAHVFIVSGGVMLFMSLLIRYVFGETILTVLGFGDRVSVWDGSGPPPIYHGIPGAAVVRFQGMLEGPNQMAFFLLTYLGIYLTLFFRYKKYRFINSVITLLLVFLLTQTYSRSGLLGLMVGSSFLIFSYIVHKIRTWKQGFSWKKIAWKKIITTTVLVGFGGVLVLFQFGPKFTEIITRKGSTSAHFERMYIGYVRFLEQPFGHGLAQAGPASRSIASVNQEPIPTASLDGEMKKLSEFFSARNPDFIFSTEHYYIPESWYIQQLIEGGIVGFFFFVCTGVMLLFLLKKYPILIAALLGVLVMNTFLHSFESVHTALALFILFASLLGCGDKSST